MQTLKWVVAKLQGSEIGWLRDFLSSPDFDTEYDRAKVPPYNESKSPSVSTPY